MEREADLLEVVRALGRGGRPRGRPGPRAARADEHGDDGDDDQQLDQREASRSPVTHGFCCPAIEGRVGRSRATDRLSRKGRAGRRSRRKWSHVVRRSLRPGEGREGEAEIHDGGLSDRDGETHQGSGHAHFAAGAGPAAGPLPVLPRWPTGAGVVLVLGPESQPAQRINPSKEASTRRLLWTSGMISPFSVGGAGVIAPGPERAGPARRERVELDPTASNRVAAESTGDLDLSNSTPRKPDTIIAPRPPRTQANSGRFQAKPFYQLI